MSSWVNRNNNKNILNIANNTKVLVKKTKSIKKKLNINKKKLNINKKSFVTNINKNKIIIFKASGGLTHMLFLLTQVIYLSKLLNKHLVIDCNTHSAFNKKFSDYFIIDDDKLSYSSDYKNIPESYKFHGIDIKTLEKTRIRYNEVYKKYYINNIPLSFNIKDIENDIIVLSGYKLADTFICKNIKLKSNILNSIKKNQINERYISVHFRNTDINNDIDEIVKKIKNATYYNNINKVYLATDDCFAYNILVKNLPTVEIIQYTKPGNFKGGNIHYNTEDKDKLIYNCLLDMYMIVNSSIFIPSINSGLSRWIIDIINSRDSNNIFNIKSNTLLFENKFDVLEFLKQPFYGNGNYENPIKINIVKDNIVKVSSNYKWKEDFGILDIENKKILFNILGRRTITENGIIYDLNGSSWNIDKRFI